MARAFEQLVKRLAATYGIAAWMVTGSYDRGVVGKDAAGRRYRESVSKLGEGMLRSFSASSGYRDITDLVRDRTRRGSAVADVIEREALRVDERLALLDREAVDPALDERGPWDVAAIGFALDPTFRSSFEAALAEDGFRDDPRGLWSGIDRIAASLGDDDSDYQGLVRCQREMVEALVLAALTGPRDYAQLAGHGAGDTPVPALGKTHGSDGVAGPGAQLQGIVPTGPNPWDYLTGPRGARKLSERGARLGRDELWCRSEGYTPVVVAVDRVSREHCAIERRDEGWVLRDESTNGTLVVRPDGTSLILSGAEAEVCPGDIICLAPRHVAPGYEGSCFSWELGESDTCFRFEARLR